MKPNIKDAIRYDKRQNSRILEQGSQRVLYRGSCKAVPLDMFFINHRERLMPRVIYNACAYIVRERERALGEHTTNFCSHWKRVK